MIIRNIPVMTLFQLFNRPPIPSSLTEEVRRKLPNSIFTSNPCRIQYCTQEIVIFREDIVTKMCRNCVKFPADNDVPTHVSFYWMPPGIQVYESQSKYLCIAQWVEHWHGTQEAPGSSHCNDNHFKLHHNIWLYHRQVYLVFNGIITCQITGAGYMKMN